MLSAQHKQGCTLMASSRAMFSGDLMSQARTDSCTWTWWSYVRAKCGPGWKLKVGLIVNLVLIPNPTSAKARSAPAGRPEWPPLTLIPLPRFSIVALAKSGYMRDRAVDMANIRDVTVIQVRVSRCVDRAFRRKGSAMSYIRGHERACDPKKD